MSAVWQNAAGGKGPCSGHVGGVRTREGMSGETGTNHPGGRASTVQKRANCHADCGSRPSEGGTAVDHALGQAWRLTSSGRRGCGSGFGVRVMLRLERPLGSRVREIRTHGLTGGPTCNRAVPRLGLG